MSSSNSVPAKNRSCAHCHKTAASLNHSLSVCAKCKSIRYCSRDCQSADWSVHKPHCGNGRFRQDTPIPRNRVTTRMTLAAKQGEADESRNPDEIYYPKTHTPHLHDVSLSGPYHPLESLIYQGTNIFEESGCPAGAKQLTEFYEQGAAAGWARITAPINRDPNRTKSIFLVTEENATMARKLPGDAWYVVVTDVDMDEANRRADFYRERNLMPVRDMEVRGTFDKMLDANERATAVARELTAVTPHGRWQAMCGHTPGAVEGIVRGRNEDGSTITLSVSVRFDDGTTHPRPRPQT